MRWKLQGGTITPESFAIAGGRATFEANGWTAHYYITDHLGSTRAVANTNGYAFATFDYTPYGSLLNAEDTPTGTDYLFTGKERQAKQGAGELYDSQARFMDTGGRFLSIDPLAEKYYHLSPYAYCAGDPVNMVDPEGELPDFFWDIYSVASGIYSAAKNTIKGEFKEALKDAAGVGLDVVSAVIPGVPAIGRVLRNGDKLVDIAKGADRIDDVVDAGRVVNKAEDVVDAGKTTKTLKEGPKPNGGKGGKHGNPDHNKAIDDAIKALPDGAYDIRKNQVQVDFNGNRVGNNRPDIQYNLNGKHYNIEIDRNLKNSQRHETVIMKNDPNSIFTRKIIK